MVTPVKSFMSSVNGGYISDKCIDGSTNGPKEDMCHTKSERAPWLAISFGEHNMISVKTVVLFNRNDYTEKPLWARTKNVEIRLANELPTSAEQMFTGGVLVGSYDGPAGRGEIIEIRSLPEWQKKRGRYLIIQMDMKQKHPLHLKEVFVYGLNHLKSTGAIELPLHGFYCKEKFVKTCQVSPT